MAHLIIYMEKSRVENLFLLWKKKWRIDDY